MIGDPVAHSASPALHRALLTEAGLAGSYEAIRVAAGGAAAAIEELRCRGYAGLNVTTPLKEEAFARADDRDAAALAARSVNTLVLGDTIAGYNTDGSGAIGALRDAGLADLDGKRILVLGAGPTARSCLVAFAAAGARTILWNRTPETALRIASELGTTVWSPGDAIPDAALSALPPNATLVDPALRRALVACPFVVDANYGPRSTLAVELGCPVHDGAQMLAHSAAASFARFAAASR